VPRRQDRHRAMHDRPRLVHPGAAEGQPRRAGGCAEQGEARRDERNFSEEAFGVEHDGSRGQGRPHLALGAAMTLAVVVVKDRRRPWSGLNPASAYADGALEEGIMLVPDSGSPYVVLDGQQAAVQTLAKEVDLGS